MFITKQHVIIPKCVKIVSNPVEVVSSFKLLGIKISKTYSFIDRLDH